MSRKQYIQTRVFCHEKSSVGVTSNYLSGNFPNFIPIYIFSANSLVTRISSAFSEPKVPKIQSVALIEEGGQFSTKLAKSEQKEIVSSSSSLRASLLVIRAARSGFSLNHLPTSMICSSQARTVVFETPSGNFSRSRIADKSLRFASSVKR